MKKMISWNVNGLRACLGKGFLEYLKETEADIFCIQESKLQEGQVDLELPGYHQYWNYAEKKGYSGTAMFTYAMITGVKQGWLKAREYAPAVRKAWLSLVSYINENGDVTVKENGRNVRKDHFREIPPKESWARLRELMMDEDVQVQVSGRQLTFAW